MADFPTVPAQDPGQSTLSLAQLGPPYTSLWWTTQNIADIPQESLGLLVAQGWRIEGEPEYDDSTSPPTPSYTMQRNSMQNWAILQSLLNSYTVAYNDARWANQVRYNQIVTNWTEMVTTNQEQADAETSQHNTHASLYLGNLEKYMDEVEALVGSGDPELNSIFAAIEPWLDAGDDEYDTFKAAYDTILALLPTDYTTHQGLASGYLTDLGVTELARINEKFTASLATQTQQLVDRGMDSSGIITDITARNTRDKNEEVAALNDRLNRAKLENQHKMYGQQQSMRDRSLAGEATTFSLYLELLKLRIASMLQNAELQIKFRSTAVAELMSVHMARLNGARDIHEAGMKLMSYQLNTRNNALVGLYGFVRDRTDEGPRFEDLSKICVGLGDAGGGWLSPT